MMKLRYTFIFLAMIILLAPQAFSAMGSANFTITSHVMSCGGGPMTSAGFKANSTLGQPSPIQSVYSATYILSSGFWYTMVSEYCIWDLDPDGDVDGLDLFRFLNPPYNASDIENFGLEFGRTGCQN